MAVVSSGCTLCISAKTAKGLYQVAFEPHCACAPPPPQYSLAVRAPGYRSACRGFGLESAFPPRDPQHVTEQSFAGPGREQTPPRSAVTVTRWPSPSPVSASSHRRERGRAQWPLVPSASCKGKRGVGSLARPGKWGSPEGSRSRGLRG